ncbi:hypothetical protein EJB05_56318, partial [Eragrostis curvula]
MGYALPALLLVVVVHASAAAVQGASGAETPTTATALDQVCGSLGGYYVTPSLCLSALCRLRPVPRRPHGGRARGEAGGAQCHRGAAQHPVCRQRNVAVVRRGCAVVPASVRRRRARAALGGGGRVRRAVPRRDGGAADGAVRGDGILAAGVPGPAALPPENGRFSDMAFVAHAVIASMARN